MEFVQSFPLLIILILLISALGAAIIKSKAIIKGISITSMIICIILSGFTLSYVSRHGEFTYRIGHWDAPWGIEFKIGNIEGIMSLLFTVVSALIIWYSFYSIHKDVKENKIGLFYLLINILIGALLGIIFSNDIFNCFVFIEISTLASCGIVVIKDKKENIKAALKYLITSTLGSGLFLMGIAFLYSITGNLNMTFAHKELLNVYENYSQTILIMLSLFAVGLGVKSAMFPLHTWLPDAHSSAPASSSAILSSLVLKAFVILLIKILYRVFGLEIISQFRVLDIIMIAGTAGMILGSVLAIMQKDIKRMIAYSSVAQMGYIFMGIGIGNEIGLIIAIYHIIGHAITKSALFLSVGNIMDRTGKRELKDLKGIGKEMPAAMGIFTIGALSMVGIPVLPGFISKWYLALAAIDSHKLILVGAILLSSLLNAVYYFPVVINAYFGEENLKDKAFNSKQKPLIEIAPLFILIAGVICVGLASRVIMNLIGLGLA